MSTAALTYEAAPAAYNQQFGLNIAGHVWQYKLVTSDATGLNIANGPAILGGIYLIAAGTMAAAGTLTPFATYVPSDAVPPYQLWARSASELGSPLGCDLVSVQVAGSGASTIEVLP